MRAILPTKASMEFQSAKGQLQGIGIFGCHISSDQTKKVFGIEVHEQLLRREWQGSGPSSCHRETTIQHGVLPVADGHHPGANWGGARRAKCGQCAGGGRWFGCWWRLGHRHQIGRTADQIAHDRQGDGPSEGGTHEDIQLDGTLNPRVKEQGTKLRMVQLQQGTKLRPLQAQLLEAPAKGCCYQMRLLAEGLR
ncbi:hypothetical protein H696_03895 [Fonticula alba]|uniref:Uncharacterized protein n=1 Tax=Fonticula alba TaxID=691883 RepID=A0A058Z5V9_FONAL|nr:hypothetical protein H696_03895 [Fonticula alba]KCV69466.1 hypothetical protein H696_03895 [Fonticula alba]|eukprot:XP_009496031.1 hypothetical protein H696_03895 [Fonticula alba]